MYTDTWWQDQPYAGCRDSFFLLFVREEDNLYIYCPGASFLALIKAVILQTGSSLISNLFVEPARCCPLFNYLNSLLWRRGWGEGSKGSWKYKIDGIRSDHMELMCWLHWSDEMFETRC